MTGTNNVAYSNAHAKAIVDAMKERNIPAYIADPDYYSLARVDDAAELQELALETIHQYLGDGLSTSS